MDAGFELIAAMIAKLMATADVTTFVGDRIFEKVPQTHHGRNRIDYPYISFGPTDAQRADFDCIPGTEITVQIDVWSSGTGEAYSSAECRKLANAVEQTLHEAELDLQTNALATLQCRLTRVFQDQDPAIHHGVVQFTAEIELR